MAVRARAHVADTLTQITQQPLFCDDLIAVERQPDQVPILQGTDEEALLPLRIEFCVVKSHSRNGRGLQPHVMWRLRSFHFFSFSLRDGQPRIIPSVGCQRPTIIAASARNIDFVASSWPMFMSPDLPRPRVQRRALLVPVAIAPDFRPRALLAHEWIIRLNRSIRVKTNQLPMVLVQVLGSGPCVVLVDRDDQISS